MTNPTQPTREQILQHGFDYVTGLHAQAVSDLATVMARHDVLLAERDALAARVTELEVATTA